MYCAATAIPSTNPTMLPVAPRYWVRKIGMTGYSISVEMSAKREVRARRKVFLVSPAKYFLAMIYGNTNHGFWSGRSVLYIIEMITEMMLKRVILFLSLVTLVIAAGIILYSRKMQQTIPQIVSNMIQPTASNPLQVAYMRSQNYSGSDIKIEETL